MVGELIYCVHIKTGRPVYGIVKHSASPPEALCLTCFSVGRREVRNLLLRTGMPSQLVTVVLAARFAKGG